MNNEPVHKETEDGRVIHGNGAQLDYLMPKQTFQSVWESPEAFARYIETLDRSKSWGKMGFDEDEQFTGTKDMDEALKLAKYGWKEGADQIEKLRSRIQAANPKSPKMIRYGLAGSTPNVPRAVSGNIFNMRQPEKAKSHKKPVITLVSNMVAAWYVNKDAISNQAATIAAIVDEVESQGYSCEVIATAMSRGYGKDKFQAATSIIIKHSHQPVDTMKLAFGLGHASLFRRMIFADWCAEKTCKNGLGSGLGSVGGGFAKEQEELLEKGVYLLPSVQEKPAFFETEEVAMEKGLPYLMQHLKDMGCPPFKDIPEWAGKTTLEGLPCDPDYDEDEDD